MIGNWHGNRHAGWVFFGRRWFSWGPRRVLGRWTVRTGRA